MTQNDLCAGSIFGENVEEEIDVDSIIHPR